MASRKLLNGLSKKLFGAWPAHRRKMLIDAAMHELGAARTPTIDALSGVLLRISGTVLSPERRRRLSSRSTIVSEKCKPRAIELAADDEWQAGQLLRAAEFYLDQQAEMRARQGDLGLIDDESLDTCIAVCSDGLDRLAAYLGLPESAPGIEHVFTRYGASLRAKVRNIVGDTNEDLLQEVLLRLLVTMKIRAWFGELDALTNTEQIAAIAVVSIRNLALDVARHRGRCRDVEIDPNQFADPSVADFGDYIRKDDLPRFGLSRRECIVIDLRFWHGLSPAEISSIIGGTPTNVSVILHRALDKIRRGYQLR